MSLNIMWCLYSGEGLVMRWARNEATKGIHGATLQALCCASIRCPQSQRLSAACKGTERISLHAPLCCWSSLCESSVRETERGGLHILCGIVSSVCRQYSLQQINQLGIYRKSRENDVCWHYQGFLEGSSLTFAHFGSSEFVCLLPL